MKPNRILIPVAILVTGLSLGWLFGRQTTQLNFDAKAVQKVVFQPKASSDVLSAPLGGYDPAFVKTAVVKPESVPEMVVISGKLAFDAEHLHLVSSRVAGRLDKIVVYEGTKVTQGQALAELYSPEWISAQNELLLSRNTTRVFANSNQKDLLEDAKATTESARNRMRVLGASESDIERVEHSGVTADHLTLRAPINGVITKRNMDPGAYLNVGDNFMTISDVSRLWFVGNVYEQDYAKVKLGQHLDLQAQALPGKVFQGVVNFLGTNIDPVTHTLPIRCNVTNIDGSLKPEMYVSAKLTTGTRVAVVVPQSAIVSVKQNHYVITEPQPEKYYRQAVSIELLADDRSVVTSGLKGSEKIVIEGGTLINQAMSSQSQ